LLRAHQLGWQLVIRGEGDDTVLIDSEHGAEGARRGRGGGDPRLLERRGVEARQIHELSVERLGRGLEDEVLAEAPRCGPGMQVGGDRCGELSPAPQEGKTDRLLGMSGQVPMLGVLVDGLGYPNLVEISGDTNGWLASGVMEASVAGDERVLPMHVRTPKELRTASSGIGGAVSSRSSGSSLRGGVTLVAQTCHGIRGASWWAAPTPR
jgi:hypothetical protein